MLPRYTMISTELVKSDSTLKIVNPQRNHMKHVLKCPEAVVHSNRKLLISDKGFIRTATPADLEDTTTKA
jgi:hypothetical protein